MQKALLLAAGCVAAVLEVLVLVQRAWILDWPRQAPVSLWLPICTSCTSEEDVPSRFPDDCALRCRGRSSSYRDGARLRWARTSPFDDDGIFGSGKASCPAITGSGGGSVREGRQTGATIISRQDELLTHSRTYIQYGR